MLNMNNKQKSEQEKQANKVLYITVAAMLVVMAAVVLLSSMLSRAKKPIDKDLPDITDYQSAPVSSDGSQNTTKPEKPSDSLPVIADTDKETEADSPNAPDKNTVPTLALPVNGILSKEFSDKVLVYSSTMEDYRTHMGIDINASMGDKVFAAADGRVSNVWHDPMMGQCVKIEHSGNLTTIYRNLSETVAEGISIGASVSEGDVIGYIGESAMVEIAQEPHLHFEVQLGTKSVDPIEYMSSNAKSKLLEDVSYEG